MRFGAVFWGVVVYLLGGGAFVALVARGGLVECAGVRLRSCVCVGALVWAFFALCCSFLLSYLLELKKIILKKFKKF